MPISATHSTYHLAMPNQTELSSGAAASSSGSATLVALLPVAALLGGIVSLAVGSSLAKQLFPAVGAQGTTTYRVVFSALLLIAIWRPWRWPLTARDVRSVILYGVALGAMNLLFYMALKTIPLGIAVAIEFTGPLVVAMASSRRLVDFIWIAFAVAGLVLLLPLGHGASSLDPVGVAYVLAAAVCWALYIIFGQRAGSLHGGQAVALGMSVAALTVLPFGVAHAGMALLDPSLLLVGLGVAILSSTIPYSLEMVALKRLPRHTFGILLSMEPAISALAALVILGEHLSALEWFAIASIIVASAGSTVTAHRARVAKLQAERDLVIPG